MTKVAVTSRSFSKNEFLVQETLNLYPNTKFNTEGLSLQDDELVNFLKGSERAIIALEKITGKILDQVPELKHISKYGVGIDNIDLEALHQRGVTLSWTGGVNRNSVAELTLAFLISLIRNVQTTNQRIKKKAWKIEIGKSVSEVTIGLVGLGHVGKEVVRLLAPFQTTIYAYDIQESPDFCKENNVIQCSLDELLKKSDVVSLHIPRTSKTRDMVDSSFFSKMRDGSYLINTSRGGIVDESSLYESLKTGKLSGAAFDVFAQEPNSTSPLFELDEFISTPHIGGSSNAAIKNMGLAAIKGLNNFKEAKWENFFNYPE